MKEMKATKEKEKENMSDVKENENTVTVEDLKGNNGVVIVNTEDFIETISSWFNDEEVSEVQETLESLENDILSPIPSVYFEEDQDFLGIKITKM